MTILSLSFERHSPLKDSAISTALFLSFDKDISFGASYTGLRFCLIFDILSLGSASFELHDVCVVTYGLVSDIEQGTVSFGEFLRVRSFTKAPSKSSKVSLLLDSLNYSSETVFLPTLLTSLFFRENGKEDFTGSTSELLRTVGAKLHCHLSPAKFNFCLFDRPQFEFSETIAASSSTLIRSLSLMHSFSLRLRLPSLTASKGTVVACNLRMGSITSSD